MNVQCPKCFWIVPIDDGRYPPWCKKCGVDLRRTDYIPVAVRPVEPEPLPAPAYSYDEPQFVVQSVTSSGRKGWLDKAKNDAAVREEFTRLTGPEAAPPAAEPLPAPKPVPSVAPDEESKFGLIKAGGLILLFIALVMAGNTWNFNKHASETTGRVKVMAKFAPGQMVSWRMPYLVYTANGIEYDRAAEGRHNEGDAVPLVYDTRDPTRIRYGQKGDQYTGAALAALVGLVLVGVSVLQGGQLQSARDRAFAPPKD